MRKFYKGNIKPNNNTIFVFGSNTQGRHGLGNAKIAREQFGAIYGQSKGLQGSSYAIITKDLTKRNCIQGIPCEQIVDGIRLLYETARSMPHMLFKIAYRHTDKRSLCGYNGYDLISMFNQAGSSDGIPNNIVFSYEWNKTNLLGVFEDEEIV